MSKPTNLATKIFLDGGLPQETKDARNLLGFLDGQTTNPTLITKHPSFATLLANNQKISEEDAWKYYKTIVNEISPLVNSVSIEVYADKNTTAEEMITKGKELFSWVPNAHVKLPITSEGLKAAEALVAEGILINMTLCFSQQQAAAVYAATHGAKKGDIYVSPFIGRLDDRGENGMMLIENILQMYQQGDGHVEVLVASVRTIDHFLRSLQLKTDIITAPFKILQEWKQNGMQLPNIDYKYETNNLTDIAYQQLDLSKSWQDFDIQHELTDKGLERFSNDWNAIIQKN